jgi:hypothetical protein
VPDAPDPLGKRALFWAPAERHDAGPRGPEKRIAPGRQALFSASATKATSSPAKKNGRPRTQSNGTPLNGTRRPARAARPARAQSATVKVEPRKPDVRRGGPISLSCSKCGTHTDVDILKYMTLHLPWWFWRPGRGYTSLMKCPACGKRAWVSASWSPWQR